MNFTVESPAGLTSTQRQELIAKLQTIFKSQTINLVEVVDPKIIAGIRLTTSTSTLDLTLNAKLNSLKLSLLTK